MEMHNSTRRGLMQLAVFISVVHFPSQKPAYMFVTSTLLAIWKITKLGKNPETVLSHTSSV